MFQRDDRTRYLCRASAAAWFVEVIFSAAAGEFAALQGVNVRLTLGDRAGPAMLQHELVDHAQIAVIESGFSRRAVASKKELGCFKSRHRTSKGLKTLRSPRPERGSSLRIIMEAGTTPNATHGAAYKFSAAGTSYIRDDPGRGAGFLRTQAPPLSWAARFIAGGLFSTREKRLKSTPLSFSKKAPVLIIWARGVQLLCRGCSHPFTVARCDTTP